jgi:hypothetical protein
MGPDECVDLIDKLPPVVTGIEGGEQLFPRWLRRPRWRAGQQWITLCACRR